MPKQQQSSSFRMTVNGHELCGNLINGCWQYDSTISEEEFSGYDGHNPEAVIALFVRRASAETPEKKS